MFVWVIPDNFSHLYALPAVALNRLRTVLSRKMDVQIEGDSQISLFAYDNDTFVVHSFHNAPTQVNLVVKTEKGVTEILTGEKMAGTVRNSDKVNDRPIEKVSTVTVTLPPHSFRAFKINR